MAETSAVGVVLQWGLAGEGRMRDQGKWIDFWGGQRHSERMMNAKTIFTFWCATATAFASSDDPSRELVAALGSSWRVLDVAAVVTDSCMGSQRFGFRLNRENERITLTTMKTQGGEIVLGLARDLSKSQFDSILRMTAVHYDAALISKSTREALNEQVAILAPEDRLKEIARVSLTTDLTSLGISISFGNRLTDQRFEDDFDKLKGTAFATWIVDPIDSK
jgi:hypothetical protein